MNVFSEIATLFRLRSVGSEIIQEARTMDGVKAGWQTSEFWAKVLTVDVPTLIAGVKGILPANVAAYVLLGSNVAYQLLRVWLKRATVAANATQVLTDLKSGDTTKLSAAIDVVTSPPAS